MRLSSLSPKFLLLLLSLPQFSAAASAILGIDLGQEFFKAALVKPGIPLEIVLTKDSRRKEASAIAFKASGHAGTTGDFSYPERLYGVDAANLAARFPQDVYPNLKQLLGKHVFDDPVTAYSGRYPALQLMPSDIRPTTSFKSDASPPNAESGSQHFSVEELLAMQLKNIQKNAIALAEEKGKPGVVEAVVFTIPAYFTAEEKYSLQLAADIAGLKVVSMLSDGVAVGINYATGRDFKPEDKPETHIIYDMGAGSTTATVMRFAGKTVKDVGRYKKNITEVAVLGVSWDQGLGGDLFNEKLSQHLLNDFLETPKAKKIAAGDETVNRKELVRLNGRTAAKLWREASKVRHVLSANSEAYASVESLYEDIDYKGSKITRAQFEEYLEEYSDRITKPVHKALESAGLTLENVDSVIFHGGGVRVPWVTKLLEGLIGEGKISRTVNPDEAAVMGATFRGAALSNSFRVKEIVVHDINPYPVAVSYKNEGSAKEISQTIFPPTTPLNTEKIFPLKRTTDFSFHITQTIPSAVSGRPPRVELINQIVTKNLTATAEKLLKDHGCTDEHVRTEFQLRLREKDGLPEVMGAWAGCDVEYEDVPEVKDDKKKGKNGKKGKDDKSEGVLDGVKDFLGLKKKKDAGNSKSSAAESASTTSASAEPEASKVNLKNQEGEQINLNGKSGEKKYIKKFEKIQLELEIVKAGFPEVPAELKKASTDKLRGFDEHDRARFDRDAAFNELESTVYKLRDLLSDDSFLAASPADNTATLTSLVEEASEWLYDSEGSTAKIDVIKEKLQALRKLSDPVKKRMDEHKKRPEQIKLVREALEQTKQLVNLMEETVKLEASNKEKKLKEKAEKEAAKEAAASATPDGFEDLEDKDESKKSESTPEEPEADIDAPPTYSPEDISSLRAHITSLTSYLDDKLAEQDKLPLNADPVVTVKELEAKIKEGSAKVMEVMSKQVRAQEERERKVKAEKAKKERDAKKKAKEEKEAKKKAEEEAKKAEGEGEKKVDGEGEKKKHDEL